MSDHHPPLGTPTRRALLRMGAFSLLAVALGPTRALASTADARRLRMLNTHTGERTDVTYFDGRALVTDALSEVDHFLRDFRTGEVHPIDPGALDIAWVLARATERPGGTFEIISGYRSPTTNAALHERSAGVATHSMHLVGKAIDLRLPGVPLRVLRDAALALGRGGVGFYPSSDFVHVDTGRVRRW